MWQRKRLFEESADARREQMLHGPMRSSIALAANIAAWSILSVGAAHAQVRPNPPPDIVEPSDRGGGEIPGPTDRITDAQRDEIQQRIDSSIDTLLGAGRLELSPLATHTLLAWPLKAASGLGDYGYHGIQNFVDHEPGYPDRLRDYQCGSRTYDTTAGYNHAGIDIFTWPFPWLKMDLSQVQIVAAAPGTIIYKSDGHYDRSCTFNSREWNAVYVRHADGSVAWYGHMKSGSLTSKPVGAPVATGEYLGTVGSSGSSTGPHLHLELHDSAGTLVDPFQGACNRLPEGSWWLTQPAYRDSAINALTTGTAPPSFETCPNQEVTNAESTFAPGSRIYFTAYYRDQVNGQVSTFRILRPDGSVYRSWTQASPSTYNSSYWYWSFDDVGAGGPVGLWSLEVAFQGTTYVRTFTIGSSDSDSDGLPNAWETQFGLDAASAAGANGPNGDPDNDGKTNAQELADGTHPRGFHTRYFAEGSQSAFFDTRFALLNPAASPAKALVRFLRPSDAAVPFAVTVGPNSRATVTPSTIPGVSSSDFSVVLESDLPLVADRQMTWAYGQAYGSHGENSVAAPSTRWYFAEGATHPGFELFYLIQNPTNVAATVDVEYLLASGPPVLKRYLAPANSRLTVWANIEPELRSGKDVSATFTSSSAIIVERAMYFGGRPDRPWSVGHSSAGVTEPATEWFLAEGATGAYFDNFVLVANPNSTPALE